MENILYVDTNKSSLAFRSLRISPLLLISIISLVLHFPIFKLDLIGIHVWRQTQTQTVIQNFYKEDFNIFNPKFNDKADTDRIVRMEFPIMQWIFACFYKVFGDHVIISRILTFIIGLFSVYGFYYLTLNIFDNKTMATIGAWCFNFSPLFYYYTVNPLPDNFALCCAIWGAAFFFKWSNHKNTYNLILYSFFISLATLAKLPFILYSTFLMVYILLDFKKNSFKNITSNLAYSTLYVVFILPAIIWYVLAVPTWKGNGIVGGILESHMSFTEVFEILYGTIVSKLPELLINYGSVLFFIAGFYLLFTRKKYRKEHFPLLMVWGISLILYFIFEMNMITLVHDYYLFPFLPAIFLIVAYGAHHLYSNNKVYIKYIVLLALCILPTTAYIRAQSRWNTESPGFNAAYYQYKNELRSLVPDNAYCVVGNDISHFITLYYIDKKGWTFDNDLTPERLQYYIGKGAQYIFIDSDIDQKPEFKKHLSKQLFNKGSLRVYKLNL